ncbi:hypothetical protein TNIN_268871 [Trichonephila inaurata madagascariensis]|uniref:Uncharacterized protein n=1 Tax=Trichonephila inaurata madagascariensis TaxID=2747483 RepID=A0A8X6WQP2_9ARAC|nr:hypothetical protein TNIN_268871 [Trichonephila inaurata madagascariensis]
MKSGVVAMEENMFHPVELPERRLRTYDEEQVVTHNDLKKYPASKRFPVDSLYCAVDLTYHTADDVESNDADLMVMDAYPESEKDAVYC